MKIQAYKNNTQNNRQNFGSVSFRYLTSPYPRILLTEEQSDVVHCVDNHKTFISSSAIGLNRYITPIVEAVNSVRDGKIKTPIAEVMRASGLENVKNILLDIIEQMKAKKGLSQVSADKLLRIVYAANEQNIIPIGITKYSGLSLGKGRVFRRA